MAGENTIVDTADGNKSVIEAILQRPAKSASNIRMVKEDAPKADDKADEADDEPLDGEEPLDGDENLIEDPSGDDEIVDPSGDDEENPDEVAALDDKAKVEVMVDGKPEKVTLADLKKNFSGNKAIDARVQKATEKLNEASKWHDTILRTNTIAAQRLAQIDEVLQKVAQPEINWEELKAKDHVAYLAARDEQRQAQEKRDLIKKQRDQLLSENAAIQQKAADEYVAKETETLISKMPHMRDPVKAKKQVERFQRTGSAYGYTPEEIGGVADHRAFLVLEDAAKWRAYKAKLEKAKQDPTNADNPATKAPKTVIRGSQNATAASIAARRKQNEAVRRKAEASGEPDDIAQLLLVRKGGR